MGRVDFLPAVFTHLYIGIAHDGNDGDDLLFGIDAHEHHRVAAEGIARVGGAVFARLRFIHAHKQNVEGIGGRLHVIEHALEGFVQAAAELAVEHVHVRISGAGSYQQKGKKNAENHRDALAALLLGSAASIFGASGATGIGGSCAIGRILHRVPLKGSVPVIRAAIAIAVARRARRARTATLARFSRRERVERAALSRGHEVSPCCVCLVPFGGFRQPEGGCMRSKKRFFYCIKPLQIRMGLPILAFS